MLERDGIFIPFKTFKFLAMKELADDFRSVVAEPREIYLSVQEVRSLTVYIRWRKKGVKGQQSYLVINSIEGSHFMLRQPPESQKLYLKFNQRCQPWRANARAGSPQ